MERPVVVSPKCSASKRIKIACKSPTNLHNQGDIATDSDLEDPEFDVLRQLPTWKKLKLSVNERRQRWRQKHKKQGTEGRNDDILVKEKQQQIQVMDSIDSINQNNGGNNECKKLNELLIEEMDERVPIKGNESSHPTISMMESTEDITQCLDDDPRPISLHDTVDEMHLNESIESHDIHHSNHSIDGVIPVPDEMTPITPMSVALRTVHPSRDTFSDLDFSSDTDGFEDIIKGPSPPPKRVMSSELKAMCGNLIHEMLSSPRSFYFSDYFPFQKWALSDWIDHFGADYLHLNIVRQRLENNEYETPGLFAADVRGIFQAATLYHWEGAKQYRIKAKATLLAEEFEEKYLDILAEDEVSQRIRQDFIQSMQQREEKNEKRQALRRSRSSTSMYREASHSECDSNLSGDGDLDCTSSSEEDEYSISTSTMSRSGLTNRASSIHEASIIMNVIPENEGNDNGDEIGQMMKQLQELTQFADDVTMKETNDYMNEIRLDLMIAQKISRESPRLQKMRFLKQLHAAHLLMEQRQSNIISYRTVYDPQSEHLSMNKDSIKTTKQMLQRQCTLQHTMYPDEEYNGMERDYNLKGTAPWNGMHREQTGSITSRGSTTFLRAHDLSIRYAVNFPKSITLKAPKRRKSESSRLGSASLSMHDVDGANISHSSLPEVDNEEETEDGDFEFEPMPTEMTDEKLIEEHTDDLWAAMPLVPADILENARNAKGVTITNCDAMTCSNVVTAEKLVSDRAVLITHNCVRTQFMTHFGKLKVGRDVFVEKLHEIFDAHSEFTWRRLHLPHHFVTPKRIIPKMNTMHCVEDIEAYSARLNDLLDILAPNPLNVYQHKLYLYELLKLSGVLRIEESPPPREGEYDAFILSLDQLDENHDHDHCDIGDDEKGEYAASSNSCSTIHSMSIQPLDEEEEENNENGDDRNVLLNEETELMIDAILSNQVNESRKGQPGCTPIVKVDEFHFFTPKPSSFELLNEMEQHSNPQISRLQNDEIDDAQFPDIAGDWKTKQCAMNPDSGTNGTSHNEQSDKSNGNGNEDGNGDGGDERNGDDAGDSGDPMGSGSGGNGSDDKGDDEKQNNFNGPHDDDEEEEETEEKEEKKENKEELEQEQKEKEEERGQSVGGIVAAPPQQPVFVPPPVNGGVDQDQPIQIMDVPLENGNGNQNENENAASNSLRILFPVLIGVIGLILGFYDDIFGSDQSEQTQWEFGKFFEQTRDFLQIYDEALRERERDPDFVTHEAYTASIPEDNPSEEWIHSLHVGSMVDAYDVEKKWYTAFITNMDRRSGKVKVHYDDWSTRFDEWIDPKSGKLAPYRSRAIGGRFQGGLPGRVALPIRPQTNDSVLSDFYKMRLELSRQQSTIPDVIIKMQDTAMHGEYAKFEEILKAPFYEIGIISNDRAVYMNRHGIYLFFAVDKEWCVGPTLFDEKWNRNKVIFCEESAALRPDLISSSTSKVVKFERVIFEPSFLRKYSRISKAFGSGSGSGTASGSIPSAPKTIGQKGLENIPKTTLKNEMSFPRISLGTAGLNGDIIAAAAEIGYYMFDTGTQSLENAVYFNHEAIHHLFEMYGRATIGISTKIPAIAHGYHATIRNFISQLDTLGTDYIDLVVMQHPDCISIDGEGRPDWVECEGHWIDTWRAMEYLYEKKRIRALGVSQFSVVHLDLLMKFKQKHVPLSVVRDWRDPMFPNTAVVDWCRRHDVLFQAFSPFGGQRIISSQGDGNPILMNPTLRRIAERNEMTIAQILIRWNMQRGVAMVFRSGNEDHLAQNLQAFDHPKLSEAELLEIEGAFSPQFEAAPPPPNGRDSNEMHSSLNLHRERETGEDEAQINSVV